jgi:hypothetical protein
MDGRFKVIVFVILFSACQKKNNLDRINQNVLNIKSGKEFITQNINFLIDSVEGFDMSKIPRPAKFNDIKIEKFKIGLLDSILIDNNSQEVGFLKFNLDKDDLVNYK